MSGIANPLPFLKLLPMPTMQRAFQTFWWSYVLIFVVFSSFQITQIDLWWQLPEGLQILRTGHLPTQPVAAFGFPASPYFDEYAGTKSYWHRFIRPVDSSASGSPSRWFIC